MRLVWVLTLLASACGSGSAADATEDAEVPCAEDFDLDLAMRIVALPDVVDGQVDGSNIDDRVSDERDEGGCRRADLSDPSDGEVGVDNQLAVLKPNLDSFLEDGVNAAIERSSVSVRVVSDAASCPGLSLEVGGSRLEGTGAIDDAGVIRARFEGEASFSDLLGAGEPWNLSRIHLRIDPDLGSGVFSGALRVEDWATFEGVPDELLRNTLESVADLPSDTGECRLVSVGLLLR